jgi:hypothetical protein
VARIVNTRMANLHTAWRRVLYRSHDSDMANSGPVAVGSKEYCAPASKQPVVPLMVFDATINSGYGREAHFLGFVFCKQACV